MAQNAKWDRSTFGRLQGKNISQVYAQADRLADLQAMGLAALVQKANTLTAEIEQLMQQRQTEGASYMQGEMKAARAEAEDVLSQLMQYINALLVVSPDAALEDCAAYIQQDLNKVEAQYQQSRRHKPADDGSDATPVEPEA